MHRPELFQTNMIEIGEKIEGREAILVNCGQTTDNGRNMMA